MIGKGHQGAFVTLDERKTKLRLAWPVTSKKATEVSEAIQVLLNPIKRFVKTITFETAKSFHRMRRSRSLLSAIPILPSPTMVGNADRMKMPMDYSGSISQNPCNGWM